MIYGLILADNWNQFNDLRDGICRNFYGHTAATFLREHEINTDVIDFWHDFNIIEFEQILLKISNKNPLFISICSTMNKKYDDWDNLLSLIKKILPSTKVIIFGERTLRLNYDHADIYIEGYPETALMNTIKYFAKEVDSIKYSIVDGQKLVDADIDYPNDYTANTYAATLLDSDFVDSNEVYNIFFSRGCIFKCSFCNHTAIGVRKHKFERNKQSIIDEFLYAYNILGITKFKINDSTFNDSEEKTEILLEVSKLIPEKLQIVCFLRPDLLYRQPGLLDKLISVGVVAVHFGIDTLNKETGKSVGKLIDPEILKNYLKEIRQQYPNLYMYGTLIVGLPGETSAHQRQNFKWLNNEKILDMWHWFPLSVKENIGYKEVLSPIEQSPITFGYKNTYNKINTDNFGRGYRDKNLNVINWENNNFTFTSAKSLADMLNKNSTPNTKDCNPWVLFNRASVHQNINFWLDYRTEADPSDNLQDMYNKTQQFVDLYKERKKSYFK